MHHCPNCYATLETDQPDCPYCLDDGRNVDNSLEHVCTELVQRNQPVNKMVEEYNQAILNHLRKDLK